MALFKYFKRERNLPDPQGPLSEAVPSTSIEEANKEVKAELTEKCGKARAPYMVATSEQKAKVGKYTAENAGENRLAPSTMQSMTPPRLINAVHRHEIVRGTWPTTTSSALQTATAYRSSVLSLSRLQFKCSPITGVHIS